jgi:hypothetical protein
MERVFVAGRCAFTIREAAGLSAGTLTVTITRDDRLEWTYQLASRRPLAVGSGSGSACLWSAREVVVLPSGPGEDPVVLSADEDLLLVFRGRGGLGAGMRDIGPAGHRPGRDLPDRARRYRAAGLVDWSSPAGPGCPGDNDSADRRR